MSGATAVVGTGDHHARFPSRAQAGDPGAGNRSLKIHCSVSARPPPAVSAGGDEPPTRIGGHALDRVVVRGRDDREPPALGGPDPQRQVPAHAGEAPVVQHGGPFAGPVVRGRLVMDRVRSGRRWKTAEPVALTEKNVSAGEECSITRCSRSLK